MEHPWLDICGTSSGSSMQNSSMNWLTRSICSLEPGLLVGDVDPKPLTRVVGVVSEGVGVLYFVVEGV